MATLAEMLKAAGQTDEQIRAILSTLGPAQSVFETALTEADRKNAEAATKLAEAAEKERKLNEFWNNDATPQINEAFSKVAQKEAEAAFYRAQAEDAKKNGFIPADAPGYKPPTAGGNNPPQNPPVRDNGGRFVPNPDVPGSPVYLTADQGLDAISEAAYLMSEHQRLFGEPLPDLRELVVASGQTRGAKKARDIWAEKYKVAEKRAEIDAAKKAAERAAIEKEVTAKIAKEYADKYGNENTRPMMASRYPNYAKDEKTGAPDKLAWTRPDKRERLRKRIFEQIEKEQGRQVQ
jgi:hypothetical protein